MLLGHNGFLAAKLGIHYQRTFGLAILIPIVPIYGATGASFLAALPIPDGIKAAAVVPLLIVPAALAYQEEIKKSCKIEIIKSKAIRILERFSRK